MSSTPERRAVVDVVWSPAAPDDHDAVHRLLAAVVAERAGASPTDVRLAHLCPRCGSGAHGRPVVVGPSTPALHVSVARSHSIAVAAVSGAGPVGVDVEDAGATSFAGFASVALHPGEDDGPPADRAALWTRKEAVLKAVGLGVGSGLERISVGPAEAGQGRVDGLPIGSGSVAWTALRLIRGYAATVAVVGTSPPVVRVRRAASGEQVR